MKSTHTTNGKLMLIYGHATSPLTLAGMLLSYKAKLASPQNSFAKSLPELRIPFVDCVGIPAAAAGDANLMCIGGGTAKQAPSAARRAT